ncbi:hypothetical protein THASP1DRAFT_21526 [Thamnocephalis sphaerospora]|uniref:Mediator of RNA polymerase II transcription subunit 18 n=1 Tax=Thamnocephalis sphaerospora TaxID=78915 RepID=A0A4P9XYN1_9FUNG|nr:hypothetical protein THASP1DRAFT_21526 [Thamnocephalis sphaerospora]|eukprot:RKP10811.1 hypothetical protein THASP1DRAFT_21526 [Thamnocephalis sphaerospora]
MASSQPPLTGSVASLSGQIPSSVAQPTTAAVAAVTGIPPSAATAAGIGVGAQQPPVAAAAAAASTAGQYEASLHASIAAGAARARLLDRLEAMCGHGPGEPFAEHVIAFIPTDARKPMNALATQEVQLRLRRELTAYQLQHESTGKEPLACREWWLCQFGHPETRPGRQVTVRPFLQTSIEGNAMLFIAALGYDFLFEYVRRGRVFTFDNSVRVHVYQPHKASLSVRNAVASASAVDRDWIVEATAVSPDSEHIPRATEALLRLKGLLAG